MRTLFVSGYLGGIVGHHGVLNEGLNLLQKPFDKDRLLERVRAVMDASLSANSRTNGGCDGQDT